jgi:hypothetical protein
MHPLPTCDARACPLLVAAQLLTEAAAEQAGAYAHGSLWAVADVAILAQLHERLRQQLCPVTATRRLDRRGLRRLLDGPLTRARAARLAAADCPAWE